MATRAVGGPEAAPPGAAPLRVTHVIHSLGPGGAENVLVELAAAAPSAGIELQVVGLSPVDRPVRPRGAGGVPPVRGTPSAPGDPVARPGGHVRGGPGR